MSKVHVVELDTVYMAQYLPCCLVSKAKKADQQYIHSVP